MKRKWLVPILLVIALIMSGCSLVTDESDSDDNIKNYSGAEALSEEPEKDDSADALTSADTTAQAATPKTYKYPVPPADSSVSWDFADYFSNISVQDMEAYLNDLNKKGWTLLTDGSLPDKLPSGSSFYTLTDEHDMLQLMTFVIDRTFPLSNSILIRFDEGVNAEALNNRAGAVTREEALKLIQPVVDDLAANKELGDTKKNITGLFEIFIKDAYDKMQLQAFAAVSDNGSAGNFLICNGSVLYVWSPLIDCCITDVDGNGRYELLDLYGWGSGIYRVELSAYEYSNPIYFNSLTEVLHLKYHNCFVPDKGYAELKLQKTDDRTVKLTGDGKDYGKIVIDDPYLIPEKLEGFPFKQWRDSYDQARLSSINKELPDDLPDINISIDGRGLDYIVQPIKWDGKEEAVPKVEDEYAEIIDKEQFIPTYNLKSQFENERTVQLDFGESIPDKITVEDMLLDERHLPMYNAIIKRDVEILDNSRVSFGLAQHFALGLSSNLETYKKDWYRMFRITCAWEDNECVYTFMINTGLKENITEITDHDFLTCDGSYSLLSSSWGIGMKINAQSEALPDKYLIEWQADGGELKAWKEENRKPVMITAKHNGFPMTTSDDENKGAVIWSPVSHKEADEVTITAYIYKSPEDKSPVAYSALTLDYDKLGSWKRR